MQLNKHRFFVISIPYNSFAAILCYLDLEFFLWKYNYNNLYKNLNKGLNFSYIPGGILCSALHSASTAKNFAMKDSSSFA